LADSYSGIAGYDGAKASPRRSAKLDDPIHSSSGRQLITLRDTTHEALCGLDVGQAHHLATQAANGIAGSLTRMKEAAN